MAVKIFPDLVGGGASGGVFGGVKRCVERWGPMAAFVMYESLLLMVLLYGVRCLMGYKNGDEAMLAWVIISGVLGILMAALPSVLLCVCVGSKSKIMDIFFDWAPCFSGTSLSPAIMAGIHVSFVIGYICIMAMLASKSAEIVRVDQTLHLEPSCSSSRLLLVDELLTFESPDGHAAKATRVLPNQIEPELLVVDNFHNVSGLSYETKRRDAGKYELDYESGQTTTVTFSFDRRRQGFQLRLRYRARLSGSGEKCEDGGAICSANSPDWLRVNGWWDDFVPGAVQRSVSIAGCVGGACGGPQGGNWSYSAQRDESEPTRWRVVLQVPKSLGVGTTGCPLAWELPGRNQFWVAGAAALAAAVACCCFGLQFADGGDSGTFIVLILASVCFLCISAGVLFGFALFFDSRA